jgi:hypothetical protein
VESITKFPCDNLHPYADRAGILPHNNSFITLGFRPEVYAKGIGLAMVTEVLGITGALSLIFTAKSCKISVVTVFTAMSLVIIILVAHRFLKNRSL